MSKRVNGMRWLIIVAIVIVVTVICFFVGSKVYEKYIQEQMLVYHDYDKSFTVCAVTGSSTDPGEQMTIQFNGEKNAAGEFRGDVSIISEDDTILHYHDCYISCSGEVDFVLQVYDGWTSESGHPEPNSIDGTMRAVSDWSRFIFRPKREEGMTQTQYTQFVFPADDFEEAWALIREFE